MAKVFLIECSAAHWIPVVRHIVENGHCIGCWTAWHLLEADINAMAPNVYFDTVRAKRGLDPNGGEPVGLLFDAVCEQVWREDAQLVYDQMNRFDTSRDLTFVERATLFYRMLVYWRHVLVRECPDLVVFPAPPHVVYDYVILALCRRLGIRTVMFEEATIHPPYSLTMSDYREGDVQLAERACSDTALRVRPSPEAIEVVRKLEGSYAQAKPYREVAAHEKRDRATRYGAISFVLSCIRWLWRTVHRRLRSPDLFMRRFRIANVTSLAKERGVSLRESFEGKGSNLRYAMLVLANYFAVRRLKSAYGSLCKDVTVIDSAPFVYFPLAGQPERTSNPQAGIYTNLLLLANVIAGSLPDRWRLVIKEHPNQFDPNFITNANCRSDEFYRAMAAIPNVVLVRHDTDPFMLIDKSCAIATTGGTTALEAVARNKPALLFGDAWYRDCPHVHHIKDAEQFKEIPDILGAAFQDGAACLARYLGAVEHACLPFMADYPPAGYVHDAEVSERNLIWQIMIRLT